MARPTCQTPQIRSTAAWLAVWTIGLGACLFLGWMLLQRIENTTGLWFIAVTLPLAILALIAMICLYGMIVLVISGPRSDRHMRGEWTPAIQRALSTGQVAVKRIRPSAVIVIETFEDEGDGYVFDIGEG